MTLTAISPTFSNYSSDESGAASYNPSGGGGQSSDEGGSYLLRPVANAFSQALDGVDLPANPALGGLDESGNPLNGGGSNWWEQAQAIRWQGPAGVTTTALAPAEKAPLASAPADVATPAPATYISWGESDPYQTTGNGNPQGSQSGTDESGQSGFNSPTAQNLPVGGSSITAISPGPPTAKAEELAGLDEYLNSYMNQVLIREFGQGPVAPATSSAAMAQLRKYGQERYDKLGQLEQALAHIQGDYAKAREAATTDRSQNTPGWVNVQVKVAVGGDKDESGGWITKPEYHDETVRQFDATAFSRWYNSQGYDSQGRVDLKAISSLAFGQLYGNEYSHKVEGVGAEFGPGVDTFESRFDVQLGGQPQTLVLKDGRMSQVDWIRLDLNDAPELNSDDQVGWNPMVGFNTHSSNIHEDTDWLEVVVKVVIVAIVAYCTAGAASVWAAGAFGAGTAAAAVATGVIVGTATSITSGVLNGNLSWEGVFKGALLGGLGGGLSFGIGELAQSVASERFTTEALLDKDALVMNLPDGGVTGGGNVQTSFDPSRGPLIEMSDPGLQQAAFERAQQTFNNVQNVGRVVQGGLVAVAGGGDFEDGAFAAIGANLGQSAGGIVGQAVNEAAQGSISAPVAQFIGAVAGAGISSAIVNERGGDGERAFLDSVVNSAVTVAGSIRLPSAAPNSQNTGLTEPTSFSAPLFDDDGNLMPGAISANLSHSDQLAEIRSALKEQGFDQLTIDQIIAGNGRLTPEFAALSSSAKLHVETIASALIDRGVDSTAAWRVATDYATEVQGIERTSTEFENQLENSDANLGIPVAYPGPTKPFLSLEALSNPSALRDPALLNQMESRAKQNSAAVLGNLSPIDTSIKIAQTYQAIFANDPTAVWFGLAPYAVAKVGQTYADLELPITNVLDSKNASVVREGFFEGNKAIFNSMFTAEQVYQAGGTEAVRAMRDNGIKFGGEFDINKPEFNNSLVKSFEYRDLAKQLSRAGDIAGSKNALVESLRESANFEQRTVIQSVYDKVYDVSQSDGSLYRQTLRGAISGLRDSVVGFSAKVTGADSSATAWVRETIESKTKVTVIGVSSPSSTFRGSDVGDVNQRMAFVNSAANDFMSQYGKTINGLDWQARIIGDQMNLLQSTFGARFQPILPGTSVFNRPRT